MCIVMHSPEVARSRLKSWREIASYYEAAMETPAMKNWTKLRDFARGVESKPYSHTLASVGTLGSILVFRDAECVAEKGYFLIGCSPTNEPSDIRLGFLTSQEHGTAKLSAYSDAQSAIQAFERGLEEHGFIARSGA